MPSTVRVTFSSVTLMSVLPLRVGDVHRKLRWAAIHSSRAAISAAEQPQSELRAPPEDVLGGAAHSFAIR